VASEKVGRCPEHWVAKPAEILNMSLLRVVRNLSGSGLSYAASVQRLIGSPPVSLEIFVRPLTPGPLNPVSWQSFRAQSSRLT
jgi:hypothetical protein